METVQFKDGMSLKSVWFNNGEGGYSVGWESAISITVVMIPGQMCNVPWALVEFSDEKPDKLLNLALMEEVVI